MVGATEPGAVLPEAPKLQRNGRKREGGSKRKMKKKKEGEGKRRDDRAQGIIS